MVLTNDERREKFVESYKMGLFVTVDSGCLTGDWNGGTAGDSTDWNTFNRLPLTLSRHEETAL